MSKSRHVVGEAVSVAAAGAPCWRHWKYWRCVNLVALLAFLQQELAVHTLMGDHEEPILQTERDVHELSLFMKQRQDYLRVF